jgi:hypothetical protein
MIGTKNTTNKTKNHKKNELQNKYFHQWIFSIKSKQKEETFQKYLSFSSTTQLFSLFFHSNSSICCEDQEFQKNKNTFLRNHLTQQGRAGVDNWQLWMTKINCLSASRIKNLEIFLSWFSDLLICWKSSSIFYFVVFNVQ